MKLSARNQLKGKVVEVDKGAVNGVVKLDVNGQVITSVITLNAIADLDLKAGGSAIAVIKASEVMITTDENIKISGRNIIAGEVEAVEQGAVNGIVKLNTKAGKITASITVNAIADLGLTRGTKAAAVIKASNVMIGVE